MRTPFGSIGGFDNAYKRAQDAADAVAQWSPGAVGGRASGSANPYQQATATQPDGSYQTATGTTAQRPAGVSNPYEMPMNPVSIGGTNNGGLINPTVQTAAEGGKNQTPTWAGSQLGADPLFYGGPASFHLATSGEPPPPAPAAQQGPNMYRYAGSEGWSSQAPGTKG